MNIIKLIDADNNKTLSANKGDKVVISLVWKPSSGYFWQEGDSTAGLLESVRHEGSDPLPGANAIVTFTFRIQKSGEIELNLARPWSETDPPAKWFVVKVNVPVAA